MRRLAVLLVLCVVAVLALTANGSASASASGPAGTWESLVRINSGGGAYTDANGLTWEADRGFTGGQAHQSANPVSGHEPALLGNERRGLTGYDIPLTNGSYVLKLSFADTRVDALHSSFTVKSRKRTLLSKFDVAAQSGRFKGVTETFDVSVTGGHLPITFSGTRSSIAAIEVLRTTANSVYRMNVGGPAYKDTRGLMWNADTRTTGRVISTTHAIAGTSDPALYQDQRVATGGYDIKVPSGIYVLKLYFADISGSSDGSFNVNNGTVRLLSGYDGGASKAKNAADVKQFKIKVVNDLMQLRFTSGTGKPDVAAVELLAPVTQAQPAAGPTVTTQPTTTPVPGVDITTTPPTPPATTPPTTPPVTQPPTTTPPVTQPPTDTSFATPDMTGWNLKASDDFSGNKLSNQWNPYSGAGNQGVGTRNPSTLSVSNGEMTIADHDTVGGGAAWTYHSIYGRYVIRAKMDAGNGYGSSMLLWPDSEKWPQDGEIDISEMPNGDRQSSQFFLHYDSANAVAYAGASGDFTQWHTWTLDWMPDHVSVWVDGQLIKSVTNPAQIPATSMHLGVQNDVGGVGHYIGPRDQSTPPVVSLHIDSVKAFQHS